MAQPAGVALTVEAVPATGIDVQRAVDLANAAFSVHPLVTRPRTSVETFAEECPPGSRLLVVRQGDEMAGMAMIVPAAVEMFGFSPAVTHRVLAGGVPTAGDLYFGIASVLPASQGMGIGRALLGRTEAIGAQEGFRRIVLTTVRELGNVEYYERAGYEVVASEIFPPGHYSIPVHHESCLMVKLL